SLLALGHDLLARSLRFWVALAAAQDTCAAAARRPRQFVPLRCAHGLVRRFGQLTILTTRPEPTVRPPSRIAKRRPSSIAIGLPNSTVISVLSPGITISVPSGNATVPVTSVVRK